MIVEYFIFLGQILQHITHLQIYFLNKKLHSILNLNIKMYIRSFTFCDVN